LATSLALTIHYLFIYCRLFTGYLTTLSAAQSMCH
jgi:hypothetical protein